MFLTGAYHVAKRLIVSGGRHLDRLRITTRIYLFGVIPNSMNQYIFCWGAAVLLKKNGATALAMPALVATFISGLYLPNRLDFSIFHNKMSLMGMLQSNKTYTKLFRL